MLIGRFLMIVPILAIAGSMVRKQRVPPSLGTFPTNGGALGRPADRHDPDRRRADLLPGPRARPNRRAASARTRVSLPSDRDRHAGFPMQAAVGRQNVMPIRPAVYAAVAAHAETDEGKELDRHPQSAAPAASSRAALVRAGRSRVVPQARPAPGCAKPGDVRRRDRRA